MRKSTLTLKPTEKTAVMRILTETLHNIATDREILFLLFPRNENEITHIGLRYLANQYSVLDRELPGRLGELAKIDSSYFATHRETYPEMYNHLGEYIGYPFESWANTK